MATMASAMHAQPPLSIGFGRSVSSASSLGVGSGDLSLQLSAVSRTTCYPSVVCGRGDKRTAKGKRFKQSFGNARPKNPNKGRGLPIVPLPPRPPKKDPLDDGEFIDIEIDETLFAQTMPGYLV